MDTTATLEPQRTEIDAGQVGTVVLSVRNDSEIVEEYTLEVVGDLAEFCSVKPTHVSVYPGQAATAVLTVHPPRTSDVPAGEHFYGVHVLPTKQAENATVPEGTIDVLPFHDTAAELSPQTSRSKQGSHYRVAVENRGNAPLVVALTAKSASDELDLTLGESELTVGPGATATSEILAEPVERLWRGTPVAYPFTVSARPDVGPEMALAGTQYQEPVLPAWTFKALLGLVALAVLGVVASLLLDGDDNGGGEQTVEVPTVVGKSLSDAEEALREVGLEAEPEEVFHEDVAEGIVVRADPAEGADADKGSPVVLEVSKGSEPGNGTTGPPTDVVIPGDLVGRTEAEARAALSSAGLVAGTTSAVNSASVPQGVVVETEPAGGTTVPPGTPVQLVISTGMVTVPELVGLSQDEAIAALEAEDVGLAYEIFPSPAPGVPADQVLEQSPGPGESAAQGSAVALTVVVEPTVPSVPAEVELTAPQPDYDVELWPTSPWAGTVEIESLVVRNPQGDAGPFSVEVLTAPDGVATAVYSWELTDLAEDQELVLQPDSDEPGEELGDATTSESPSVELIEPISISPDQVLRLAMTCSAVGTEAAAEPEGCQLTIEVNGEVVPPPESG